MAAYFTMESFSSLERVTFAALQRRLIKAVNVRIQSGEYTERGLAKLLGISQPQIHNVLKGARKLGFELADRLLSTLGLTAFDLLEDHELAEQHQARSAKLPDYGPARLRLPLFDSIAPPKKPPTQQTQILRPQRHYLG
jgi:plasmid maintenance system antidote protein VapI